MTVPAIKSRIAATGGKLLQVALLMIVVSLVVFFGMRLGPYDAAVIASEAATDPAAIERAREAFGLDKPLHVQYWEFVSGAVQGDLGRSFQTGTPVSATIGDRIPATIELATVAMLLGSVFGVGIGFVSAATRSRRIDTGTRIFSLAGISLPTFWLGVVLVSVLAIELGVLPAGGRFPAREVIPPQVTGFLSVDSLIARDASAFLSTIRHLILPGAVLGFFIGSYMSRITRASLRDEMRRPYFRTARAKGVSRALATRRHAFRNALPPIVTIAGLQFGNVLAGAVVVETVFAWPGLGTMLVNGILLRDYPVVQAGVLLIALIYVGINMLIDASYALIDPRLAVEAS